MPENHINLTYYKQGLVFNNLLSQKWSFFAPPPNYNDRIYFIFHSKRDTSLKIFEIIEPLNLAKQKNAPFNGDEDVLDYVLSNSINGLDEGINEVQDYFNSEKEDGIIKADSLIERITVETVQKSFDFQTLKNYSKFVAKKIKSTQKITIYKLELQKNTFPNFMNAIMIV